MTISKLPLGGKFDGIWEVILPTTTSREIHFFRCPKCGDDSFNTQCSHVFNLTTGEDECSCAKCHHKWTEKNGQITEDVEYEDVTNKALRE